MSIKLNNLKTVKGRAYEDQTLPTFVDLSLDISFSKKDINVSVDEQAIKNALIMLLNTRPGENILFPEFGLNLHKNLFEQMTETNGYAIASKIRHSISRFEPRITIDQIIVNIIPDEQAYELSIYVNIPSLKFRTSITGYSTIENQFRALEQI
jgi:phage baseplate assembly protein W